MLPLTFGKRAFYLAAATLTLTACKTPDNSSAVKAEEIPADTGTPAIPSSPGGDNVPPPAVSLNVPLELGEQPFVGSDGADEATWIARLVANSDKTVARLKADTGLARRSAHSKTHGCVTGTFTMEASRPDKAKHGLFAQDGSFPVWVRFSNAFPTMQSDLAPDGRGMAIKVIDVDHKVPGQKLLPGHESSNAFDFPFVSGPVFPTRHIEDYDQLQQDAGKFLLSHKREAAIAIEVASQVMASPLGGFYWSMGAFKLGDSAVKFSTRPSKSCPANSTAMRPLSDVYNLINAAKNATKSFKADYGANYLRDALVANLKPEGGKTACFDFGVQFQADPVQMPVEDPSVEWRESQSLFSKAQVLLGGATKAVAPFVKLATITIPPQEFQSNDQFCERLSFNPWRNVAEHRPLGNLMRARLAVYAASVRERLRLNSAQPVADDLTGTKADAAN